MQQNTETIRGDVIKYMGIVYQVNEHEFALSAH